MGVQVEKISFISDPMSSAYLEIFREEIRSEISTLKDKILELEARLEDPFG